MTYNRRSLTDALKRTTKYFPTASGTANTTGIDLGATLGDPDPSKFNVRVTVAAAPAHLNTGTPLVVTVQDSADNLSFTGLAMAMSASIAGVGSTGSVETIYEFRLPPTVRQYLSILLTSPAVEDNTGVLCTVELLF